MSRPPGLTELDAWLLSSAGRPSFRLRQRPARQCFTRPRRRRCLVAYGPSSVATGYDTTSHGAQVYGWRR